RHQRVDAGRAKRDEEGEQRAAERRADQRERHVVRPTQEPRAEDELLSVSERMPVRWATTRWSSAATRSSARLRNGVAGSPPARRRSHTNAAANRAMTTASATCPAGVPYGATYARLNTARNTANPTV